MTEYSEKECLPITIETPVASDLLTFVNQMPFYLPFHFLNTFALSVLFIKSVNYKPILFYNNIIIFL